MLLLLSIFCISTALANPLLGDEQCAKGSAFWCQNLKTAVNCGALKHCQQTVWNKPTVKSIECDLCKQVITLVGNFIKENGTETELLSYLEKACSLMPDPSMASQCKQLVDEYYPVIMALVKEELENPEAVCRALQLCKSLQQELVNQELQTNKITEADFSEFVPPFVANVPLLLFPQGESETQESTPETQSNGDVCQDCVTFITDVQAEVKSNTTFVNSMIEQIMKQCDNLQEMAEMCKQYIKLYSSMVIQMLVDQNPRGLCTKAGFCQSMPLVSLLPAKVLKAAEVVQAAELAPAQNLPKTKASPVCEVCKLAIAEVDKLLENNRTKENVINALKKVCSILPSSIAAECEDFVTQYGDAVIELIVQEVAPDSVCSILGLCSSRKRVNLERINLAQVKSGELCQVCKSLVMYLDTFLGKNATQAEIEAALEKVCNFLPDTMKDQCDQIIEEYGPVLLQLLIQMMDPEFVCTKLSLCAVRMNLLGAEKCSWGPSYWCSNMETASKCNAIEHCKRHVWN
ncbi:prosaposin isoform X2 [Protopterus annectens]|uniref:prosaposin isoform X2 n=1 Tax=Protopterus annectens TaxID=7888 RepID=UPI001CF9421C|nr:prosaposin isoform X2 [Protopterus annectens]